MADVVELIMQDHRTLEKLFDELQQDAGRRPELLDKVAALLTAHSRAEEERVYPVVAKEAGERDEAHHGAEEHHEAEEMLEKLRGMSPEGKEFEEKLKEFIDAVKHHVEEEEESDILPALRDAVSAERLKELGTAFAERRRQELTDGGSGSGTGTGTGTQERTKDELYEEAKKLDVHGRSTMNKDELAEAVDHQHSS
ncbi:hemerythrin domain-containing protein [Actinoallomurus rhizosphaericola]|uniref:hemerythrin domain-containing protein n=1 Tax=Actinoallomurus rhizosphaericola TaxID=2952536 RepID=UPI0020939B25|nr:hemerythrin domain-containing protein [Actinoallomurus rhizosphaericola]MCO5997363.1 hemerythrin domain-containing protein [Actinoallomurus rhizosphaericola]